MPTEAQIWVWVAANWGSIASGILAGVIYVRLHRYIARLDRLEKRISRVMESCAKLNPEQARWLYDDE